MEAVPPPAAEDPTWERLEDQISWYDRKVGVRVPPSAPSERATISAGQGLFLISGEAANDCRRGLPPARLTFLPVSNRQESWIHGFGLVCVSRCEAVGKSTELEAVPG